MNNLKKLKKLELKQTNFKSIISYSFVQAVQKDIPVVTNTFAGSIYNLVRSKDFKAMVKEARLLKCQGEEQTPYLGEWMSNLQPDYRDETTNSKDLPMITEGHRLPTEGHRLPTEGHRLPTEGHRLPTEGRPNTENERQPTEGQEPTEVRNRSESRERLLGKICFHLLFTLLCNLCTISLHWILLP